MPRPSIVEISSSISDLVEARFTIGFDKFLNWFGKGFQICVHCNALRHFPVGGMLIAFF